MRIQAGLQATQEITMCSYKSFKYCAWVMEIDKSYSFVLNCGRTHLLCNSLNVPCKREGGQNKGLRVF